MSFCKKERPPGQSEIKEEARESERKRGERGIEKQRVLTRRDTGTENREMNAEWIQIIGNSLNLKQFTETSESNTYFCKLKLSKMQRNGWLVHGAE